MTNIKLDLERELAYSFGLTYTLAPHPDEIMVDLGNVPTFSIDDMMQTLLEPHSPPLRLPKANFTNDKWIYTLMSTGVLEGITQEILKANPDALQEFVETIRYYQLKQQEIINRGIIANRTLQPDQVSATIKALHSKNDSVLIIRIGTIAKALDERVAPLPKEALLQMLRNLLDDRLSLSPENRKLIATELNVTEHSVKIFLQNTKSRNKALLMKEHNEQ
eukprot:gene11921-13889_t